MAVHLTPTDLLRLAPFGAISAAEIQGDDAGTWGAVTHVGTGPAGALLLAGYPADALLIVVKIATGGDLGTMIFQVSKDAGATYGNPIQTLQPNQEFQTVPYVRTPEFVYEVPLTGVVLHLLAGTYIALDTYAFTTTASPRLLLHCQAVSDEFDEWFRNTYDKPEDATPNTIQRLHMANMARWRLTGGRGLDEAAWKIQKSFYDQGLEYFKLQSVGELRTPTIADDYQFPQQIRTRYPYHGFWRH